MNRTPNSEDMRINRDKITKGDKFLMCSQEHLSLAMKQLTPRAFEVYLCLMFNSNGYVYNFSPQHINELTGMCLETARKGRKELIDKGFAIPVAGKKSFYDFYETPQTTATTATKDDPISIANKALFENTTQQVGGYVEHIIMPRENRSKKKSALDEFFDPNTWLD